MISFVSLGMRLFFLCCYLIQIVTADDDEAIDAPTWQKVLTVLCLIPILGCLYSVIVLIKTLRQLTKIKNMCKDLSENTELVATAAAKASLGPSAKKALFEYAKEKPELAKLFPNNA